MKKTYVIPRQRCAVMYSDGLLQQNVSNVQIGQGTTEDVEVKAQAFDKQSVWDDEW